MEVVLNRSWSRRFVGRLPDDVRLGAAFGDVEFLSDLDDELERNENFGLERSVVEGAVRKAAMHIPA